MTTIVKIGSTVQDDSKASGQSLTQVVLRRLRRDKLTLFVMAILLVMILLAFVGAPIISSVSGVSPNAIQLDKTFLLPGSPGHILGTDDLGRDQLTRLLYAGQVSLSIAGVAAIISLVIGVSLGIVGGFYGGIVDDGVNWIITTLNSVPTLFLLLIVAAVLQPGPTTLILVLGFLGWTGTARLVRGETLSIREREYILGARAIGANSLRIMFVHILPNLFSIVIVNLAIDIGSLILAESALSFLGVGVLPPTATWGNMLTNAQTFFTKGVHLVLLPGLMIVVTVLCLYVMGDGLRDAFDPTTVD